MLFEKSYIISRTKKKRYIIILNGQSCLDVLSFYVWDLVSHYVAGERHGRIMHNHLRKRTVLSDCSLLLQCSSYE